MNSLISRLSRPTFVFLFAATAFGQGSQLPKFTVATLPSAATHPTYMVQVIDGSGASDCTVGGGSSNVICTSNGSGWIPASSGGSGTPGGANTNVQFNSSSTFGGSANLTWNNSTNTLSAGNHTPSAISDLGINLGPTVPPQTPPTATAGASGVLTGSYTYGVTYVTANGEGYMNSGSLTTPVTVSSQQVNLTNIPVSSDSNVIARHLWRTSASAAYPYQVQFLGTISNNTATTFTDNTPDGSLGAYAPWIPMNFGTMSSGTIGEGLGPFMAVANNSMAFGFGSGAAGLGYASTAMGFDSMQDANGAAIRDVSMGVFSMQNCTVCSGDTGIGVHALQNDSNGQSNIGIGYTSGVGINGGSNNIAIGGGSLNTPTSGNSNIAIGSNSLFVYTGSNALAIGFNAAEDLTTASEFTAIGTAAGTHATTANFGTFLGYNAGLAVTTGAGNTCIGAQCLSSDQTGADNDAVGFNTLAANTGSNNDAMGQAALGAQTSGGDNVGIGFSVGDTGTNNLTTSSNMVLIGFEAALGSSTQITNGIAIGSTAKVTTSNTAVIGNSSVTDVYLGSTSAAAASHAANYFDGGVLSASCVGTSASGELQPGTCGSFPTGTTNQLLYYASGGTTLTPLTLGTNLSITTGTLNASSSGSTNWSALASGTNTTMAALIGTGASLGTTGSGTIAATTAVQVGTAAVSTNSPFPILSVPATSGNQQPVTVVGFTVNPSSGSVNLPGIVTVGGNLDLINPAAATSGANQSSENLLLESNYWNGSASTAGGFNLQNIYGTGSNPTQTLTLTIPVGSTSGVSSVDFSAAAGGFKAASISSVAPAGDAGLFALVGNTTNQTCPTNDFCIFGFNSASATAYGWQPSTTAPSGTEVMLAGTPSSGASPVTYDPLAGSGAGIVTGPTTSVSTDLVSYTGTGGQTQDSGILSTNVTQTTATPAANQICVYGSTAKTCTPTTTVPTAALAGTRKWTCQTGLGDGTNAIAAATYLQSFCYNDTGSTVTITGLRCLTDNAGTSTMNASGHTLGALLTGAVTCTASWAAGTQSANVALTSGDWIAFTFVADGTSKQTSWEVSGTY